MLDIVGQLNVMMYIVWGGSLDLGCTHSFWRRFGLEISNVMFMFVDMADVQELFADLPRVYANGIESCKCDKSLI